MKGLLLKRQNRTGSCSALKSDFELESVMGEVFVRAMFQNDETGFCLIVMSP